MKIDSETIKGLAHLARLEVDKDKEGELISDLNKILSWMEKLGEVNTENVEPLRHMSHEINVLREDEVKHTLTHDEALKNGPKTDSDYFRVPKVIE